MALDEILVFLNGFNHGRFGFGGNFRADFKVSRDGGWAIKGILLKDTLSTQDLFAFSQAALAVGILSFVQADFHDLRPVIGRDGLKADGPFKGEGYCFGHFPFIPEEMLGSRGRKRPTGNGGLEGVGPWPIVDGFDQVGGSGIGEGVDQFIQGVPWFNQSDNRCGCVGPEGFRVLQVGILAAGQKTVESFEEFGKGAVMIIYPCVVVRTHHACKGQPNPGLLGRITQAIEEIVVRLTVRPKKEPPFGTAAGDHIGTASNDSAG